MKSIRAIRAIFSSLCLLVGACAAHAVGPEQASDSTPARADAGTLDTGLLPADAGRSGDGGGGSSEAGADAAASVKRVFVSSLSYAPVTMGGLTGADMKCNTAAQAAVLGGVWKAWLSDSATNAIDRIVGTGPWYLVDGTTKVFNNKANLATDALDAISMTEKGITLSNDVYTWTGTVTGGTRSTATCSSWTTDVGLGALGNGRYGDGWTESAFGPAPCTAGFQIYCFEQ